MMLTKKQKVLIKEMIDCLEGLNPEKVKEFYKYFKIILKLFKKKLKIIFKFIFLAGGAPPPQTPRGRYGRLYGGTGGYTAVRAEPPQEGK